MDATKIIYLNIAGFNIQISFYLREKSFYYKKLKEEINKYYKGFIFKEDIQRVDATIDVKDDPTFYTIRKPKNSYYFNIFKKKNLFNIETTYKISIIELQYILKEILMALLKNSGFLFHGSAISDNGKAVIFTGKSGAGKSTAAYLLKDRYELLIDDLMIIRNEEKRSYLYKTPLFEKNYKIKKTGQKFLISKIFFLKKSKHFEIIKINNIEVIIKKISNQIWTEKEYFSYYIKNCMNFTARVNAFYDLNFAKNKEKFNNFFYDIQKK